MVWGCRGLAGFGVWGVGGFRGVGLWGQGENCWGCRVGGLGFRVLGSPRVSRGYVLSRKWTIPPKDPCTYIVYTWALKGFLYCSFRAQEYTI